MKDRSYLPDGPDALLANMAWTQSLACRLVRGPEAAEELVQDTWWRMLRNPPPSGAQERPWIAAVMRRTVADGYRSAARRRRREETFARERHEAIDQRQSQDMSVHQDLVERVMELELPLRRIVLLRYFDGLSLADVAEREGLKVAGVKSRLIRAHGHLRERLKERPESPAGAWLLLQIPKSKAALPAVLLVPVSLLAMKTIVATALIAVLALIGLRFLNSPEPPPGLAAIHPGAESISESDLAEIEAADNTGHTRGPVSKVTAGLLAVATTTEAPVGTEEVTAALVIRVLDEQGKPRGGVAVQVFDMKKPYSTALWRGRTDAKGLAAVADGWIEAGRGLNPDGVFVASLDVPCGPEGAKILDPDDLGVEPVELLLAGARGTLTIKLVDSSGAPVPVCNYMSFEAVHPKGGIQTVKRRFDVPTDSITVESVELDSRFHVSSALPLPWLQIHQDIAGPTYAGEHKVVEIELKGAQTLILGRLLGPDGKPLDGAKMGFSGTVVFTTKDDSVSINGKAVPGLASFMSQLDTSGRLIMSFQSDGRFRSGVFNFGLVDIPVAGGPCLFQIKSSPSEKYPQRLLAEVEGVFPAAGETLDLGDLAARSTEIKLRGVVAQSDGAAVEGAWVRLVSMDPEVIVIPGFYSHDSVTWSDSEGRFVFYAVPGDHEFALMAGRAGFSPSARIPAREGDLEMEIELEASRLLVGTLVPPEGLDRSMIRLEVIADPGEPALKRTVVGVAPDWTFKAEGLPSQFCTLRVVAADRGQQELMRIESLLPADSQGSQDQRLASIDLRERVLSIRMDVQDQEGQPVESGKVKIAGFHTQFSAGHLAVAVPLVEGELLIGSPGFRNRRFDLSSLPTLVTLERGIPVRLMAPNPWPVELSRSEVLVTLVGRSDGSANVHLAGVVSSKAFGDLEYVDLVVPGPGTYKVRWAGTKIEDFRTIYSAMRRASKTRVEVIEGGVQVIELTP